MNMVVTKLIIPDVSTVLVSLTYLNMFSAPDTTVLLLGFDLLIFQGYVAHTVSVRLTQDRVSSSPSVGRIGFSWEARIRSVSNPGTTDFSFLSMRQPGASITGEFGEDKNFILGKYSRQVTIKPSLLAKDLMMIARSPTLHSLIVLPLLEYESLDTVRRN
jgi:hypothetical protein